MASTLKIDTITTPDGTGNITVSRPLSGSGASLTSLPAANLTGTLPAINGSSLTGISTQKNIIINGDFNIWQRGTSFAACGDNEYQADRFKYSKVGTMVHTISRDTDVPTVAESGHLSNYSLKVDCTTIDSSIDANDECHIFTHVEGYNFAPLAQKAMTLSFWHKHTKTGTYCVSMRNSGYNRTYIAEYTQSVSNTWEKAEITVSASPSAGTWNYTNGTGIKLGWSIAMGANWQNTADSWLSANDAATSSQVNACDSTSNNFMLAQVQLETGSIATDFEVRNHATELAMCQRYYFQTRGAYAFGIFRDANTIDFTCSFPVSMRTFPTNILLDSSPRVNELGVGLKTGSGSTYTQIYQAKHGVGFTIDGFTGGTAGNAAFVSHDGTDLFSWTTEL